MKKEQTVKRLDGDAIQGAYESLKNDGYAPTLGALLTRVISGSNYDYWTAFDEMAHRFYGYDGEIDLTDDEVEQAIQAFKTYNRWKSSL